MIIAVNTRFLLTDYPEGYGYFIHETFKRITVNHPEHEFIFIFDRPYAPAFVFAPNVRAVVARPAARHPLRWKLWYDLVIPRLLKKYKADVFVSCDGFCSLATQIPQCLVVHDLAFLHYPSCFTTSHLLYYKRYTPKFLKKAKRVVTISEFSKKDIMSQYPVDPGKIDVVFSAAKKIFRPMREEEKTDTRNKYTGGKEYFVYAGLLNPRKNLINLLKAFSVLKKRQQTNMKLLLAGRLDRKYDSFTKSLQSFKYRADVVMTGTVPAEELARIIGAAYGLVYPSLFEGFGMPVLEAMQSDVPVLTSARSAMEETAKEAALYAEATSYLEIAEIMMRLYKDEDLRKELIRKGRQVVQHYSWDQTADLLWQSISKAIG